MYVLVVKSAAPDKLVRVSIMSSSLCYQASPFHSLLRNSFNTFPYPSSISLPLSPLPSSLPAPSIHPCSLPPPYLYSSPPATSPIDNTDPVQMEAVVGSSEVHQKSSAIHGPDGLRSSTEERKDISSPLHSQQYDYM